MLFFDTVRFRVREPYGLVCENRTVYGTRTVRYSSPKSNFICWNFSAYHRLYDLPEIHQS